jgi:tubulin polyglutamylase TTLL6/13
MSDSPKRKRRSPNFVTVNVTNTRYSIVRQCCQDLGYKITESDAKALLFWCDAGGSFDFTSALSPWQFYNHFPGTWALARKVDLARNIERLSRILPDVFTFHPKSFIVPAQTTELQSYMTSARSRRTFIVKPDRGSLGKGISLIRDPAAIDDWTEMAVAQQYIAPRLIDGLKFDLRIYALVTSVEPLRIYLHDEGMARFCTHPYQKPVGSNLTLSYAHLTNYSLNKHNPNFQEPSEAEPENADHGHKRSLTSVFRTLSQQGLDIDNLKTEIEDIVRLAIISIQPLLATNYRTAIPWHDGKSRCFEVLGFDILIDKHGRPWLLEVNWAPSLATGSPFDTSLKTSVVKSALEIVNITPDFKRVVKSRRTPVSKSRETIAFDPTQELERAKETQYRLIYPIEKSHPKFEITERAFAASRKAVVGAAIRKTRTKVTATETAPKTPPGASFKPVIPKFQPIRSSSQISIGPRLLASKRKKDGPFGQPAVGQNFVPVRMAPRAGHNLPVFVQCAGMAPVPIPPAEEFERLRILGQRTTTAKKLGIADFLERWVYNPPPSPRGEFEVRPLVVGQALAQGSLMLRPSSMTLHMSMRS